MHELLQIYQWWFQINKSISNVTTKSDE
jgi:hypothetical protein